MWWDAFSTRLLCPPATRLSACLAGLLSFPQCLFFAGASCPSLSLNSQSLLWACCWWLPLSSRKSRGETKNVRSQEIGESPAKQRYWPLASWWQWPDAWGKCCYRHTPLILAGFVLHTHWAAALIICQPQKCVKMCVCVCVCVIIHNVLFICSSSAIPYL